jgi:hypothetical protein
MTGWAARASRRIRARMEKPTTPLRLYTVGAILLPLALYSAWTSARDRHGMVGEVLAIQDRPRGAYHLRMDSTVARYIPVGTTRASAIRALRKHGFRVTVQRIPLPYQGGVLETMCPDCTEQVSGRYDQSWFQGIYSITVLLGVRDGRVAYVRGALVQQEFSI